MKSLKTAFSILIVTLLLGACSLLQIKLETGTVPLTKEELKMRVMTRDFTLVFFNAIENTADEIIAKAGDRDLQTYALLWKIRAIEGVQQTVYQTSPVAGMVDTWVYVQQMTDYFTTGPGKDLFGEYQENVVVTSDAMLTELETLAQITFGDIRAASTKTFVEKHAKLQAFNNISFSHTPSFGAWLEYHEIKADDAVPNLGTMPEAFGDLSDRMSSISNQIPKIIAWKAELLARNSQFSAEQLNQTLANINRTSEKLQDVIDNNPEYMSYLAAEMRKELEPLLDQLDDTADDTLKKITVEREALEAMVARERAELEEMVARERANVTKELDKISQNVVTVALEKIQDLIKGVLVYFIIFILVIFFAPFAIGYRIGKKVAKKQAD